MHLQVREVLLVGECAHGLAERHGDVLKRGVHLLNILRVREYFIDVRQLNLLKNALLDCKAVIQIRVSLSTRSEGLNLSIAL